MENSKEVTVEWKGYCEALQAGIWKTFHDQVFVDINLTCHRQGLKVHRLMLAVFFPRLQKELSSEGGDEVATNDLCLDRLTEDQEFGDVLKYLVEFAYSGKATLPESNLEGVLKAADIVGFEGLAQTIRSFSKSGDNDAGQTAFLDKDATSTCQTRRRRNTRKGIPMKLVKSGKTTRRQCSKTSTIDMLDVVPLDDTDRSTNSNCVKRKTQPTGPLRASQRTKKTTNVQVPVSDDDDESSDGGANDAEVLSSMASSEESDSDDHDWIKDMPKSKRKKTLASLLASKQKIVGEKEQQATSEDDLQADNEAHKCEQCKYVATSSLRLKRHQAKHNKRCKECSMVFQDNKSFKDHLLSHGSELQQKCHLCSFFTQHKPSLQHHLAVKHLIDDQGNPISKSFQCSECSHSYVTNRQLRSHYMLKHPNKVQKCELCDYTHPLPRCLKGHMERVHGGAKKTKVRYTKKCKECDYTCISSSQMENHLAKVHKPDLMKMCDECGYTTSHKGVLQRHIARVHRGECAYMCDLCGVRVKSACGLERHKRTHIGVRAFQCTLCDRAFIERHNLKAHMDRKHNPEKPVQEPSEKRKRNAPSEKRTRSAPSEKRKRPPRPRPAKKKTGAIDVAAVAEPCPSTTSCSYSSCNSMPMCSLVLEIPAATAAANCVKESDEQRVAVEELVKSQASTVVRFVSHGATIDCFGDCVRAAEERFEELRECNSIFQFL